MSATAQRMLLSPGIGLVRTTSDTQARHPERSASAWNTPTSTCSLIVKSVPSAL
ncbi:hypothetical protein [Populibacterium corticicola]|uniref:hypothetical protein n=1 Tax=Populibacterium corticicola TaxID=1812826 RepID=UPI00366F9041